MPELTKGVIEKYYEGIGGLCRNADEGLRRSIYRDVVLLYQEALIGYSLGVYKMPPMAGKATRQVKVFSDNRGSEKFHHYLPSYFQVIDGSEIEKIRIGAGVGQETLGKQFGLTQAAISNIISNRKVAPLDVLAWAAEKGGYDPIGIFGIKHERHLVGQYTQEKTPSAEQFASMVDLHKGVLTENIEGMEHPLKELVQKDLVASLFDLSSRGSEVQFDFEKGAETRVRAKKNRLNLFLTIGLDNPFEIAQWEWGARRI